MKPKLHAMDGYSYGASSRMDAVLPHSAELVWSEIRDFNGYPKYIEGVTESVIEDDKAGDEVDCVRRFVYRGDVIRQTLTGHSDSDRWFSHAGCEPLRWPTHREGHVGPSVYENRIAVSPSRDADQALLAWSMQYWARSRNDAAAWKAYFDASIPVWVESLRKYLAGLGSP